jgi:hypothetical protein
MSTFCPCWRGDSWHTKRFFDVMRAGCIPIIFNPETMFPFGSFLNETGGWQELVIYAFEDDDFKGLLKKLLRMNPEEVVKRRRNVLHAAWSFLNWESDGKVNAFEASLFELSLRKPFINSMMQDFKNVQDFEV